jgi:ligand-binding sensor domain-containing protein
LVDNNSRISYFGRNEDENIYAATTDGKVFINNASIANFRLFYTSQSGLISTLSYANNNLWIGTSNIGIEVVNSVGKLAYSYSEENKGDRHIHENTIRKIIQRENGEIWVGGEGITVISPEGK